MPTDTDLAGPASRDDFRAAQRRHRLGARLRAIPAGLAAAVMGIPLSVYLSPVLLALAIFLTDLVNLVIRMPDLGGAVWSVLDRLVEGDPGTIQAVAWILVVWLVPGVVGLVVAYLVLRVRLERIGGNAIASSLGARPANPGDADERQLVDIVGELATAAAIDPPRVLLVDDAPANALVYGRDPDHATILVGRALLTELDREATQGVIARLTASASDGDLGLATDIGAVYVTYGLLTTTLSAAVSKRARVRLRAGLAALRRGAADPRDVGVGLAALLGLPMDDDVPDDGRSGCLTLLTMGGLIAVGMSLVNLFLAGPLLVFAWRSRGYLADALAVDLTRNPTALSRALAELGDGRGMPGSAWLELLLVAGGRPTRDDDPRHGRSLSDSGLAASISASIPGRIARLEAMGAQRAGGAMTVTTPAPVSAVGRRRSLPRWLGYVIVAPLVVLVAVLVTIAAALIVYLVALAACVILAVVAGPIHDILRGFAGG